MLVEKPDDVRHENATGNATAIYGVDAHPHKPLFATAGGDGSVKIWSLEPTVGDDGVASFELLATLAFHEQAVNSVRWAAHGRYLASGADDQLVLLYELQAGAPPPVAFGSNAQPNKQNWVRCSTLRRHTMDVQDVAWSPDDRLLATCSIDNTICIWDVDPTGIEPVMNQPLQTLTGHNGWVKGVAWDPVGKYLSSAGEDKTVRVWRVDNWQQAHVITEPFEACASTSHFRRLSWSPDGSVLCGTHGFKSKKNIAALLDRATWSNDVDFVGHQAVVTCARFNPKLFVKDPTADKEYACCAVGGEDATISIWLAHTSRPLTVMKECFEASVTDLTWWNHNNESTLIVSSLDGTICCFKMDAGELGLPVSDMRQSKLLQTKYGSRAGITLASTFVENPLQLQLEEKSSARKPVASTTNTLVPKKKAAETSAAAKPGTVHILQAVSKKGNKKRIAPVLLQENVGGPHASEPAPSAVAPNPASVANKIQNILGPTMPENLGDTTLLDERMTGKTSSHSGEVNGDGPTKASSDATTGNVSVSNTTSKAESKKHRDLSLKRKRDGERASSGGGSTAAGAAVMAKAKEVVPRPPKVLTQSGDGTSNGLSAEPFLPAFPLRNSFSVEIDATEVDARASISQSAPAQLIVEVTVHNGKGNGSTETSNGPVYSSVRCTQANNVKWVDRFPGQVVNAVGNATLCAIVTSMGDLFISTSSGRRLFPCIALGGAVAVAECSPRKSPYLMIILTSGVVKIWDVVSRKLQLNDSVEGLVASVYATTQRMTLLRSTVSDSGHPTLTFAVANTETKGSASLHSYTFDTGMETWMRVADDSFVYSDFYSTISTEAVTPREIPMGPLRRLQNASGFSRTQRGVASAMLKDLPDPISQRSVTRAHLEHQLAATVVVQSPSEYQYWLKSYVRFLSADEDVQRLEELCSDLLGPFHHSTRSETETVGWESDVLGFSKRELLRLHVLPTMATNRMLQRVVAKYQLMLSEISTRETSVPTDEDTPKDVSS